MNTEHFNDALVTKAHIGFLVLLIVSLLTREEMTIGQLAGVSFASAALPLLIVSLAVSPAEEKIPKWEVKALMLTNPIGHAAGLLSFACILWSITAFAAVLFALSSAYAVIVWGATLVRKFGTSDAKELLKAITIDEE